MAYSYKATITVDATKVSGTSNLTNFPILVSGTYDGTGGEPDLRTTANGGKIQNTVATGGVGANLTVPADLAFYSDSGLTTQLDHEFESYSATTGAIVAWVKIPTLDYDDNTVIYMAYGDSGVVASQEDIANVWTVYTSVWHMKEDPDSGGAGDIKDSKGAHNATASAPLTSADLVDAQVGKGIAFVDGGGTPEYISAGDHADFEFGTGPFTAQCWVKRSGARTAYEGFMGKGYTSDWIFRKQSNAAGNRLELMLAANIKTSGLTITDTNPHFVAFNYNGSQINFVLDSSTYAHNTTDSAGATAALFVFGNSGQGGENDFAGWQDEVRIAKAILSVDWLYTDYNNQSSPSTFYAMGSEESVGGGGGTVVMANAYMTPNTLFWGP